MWSYIINIPWDRTKYLRWHTKKVLSVELIMNTPDRTSSMIKTDEIDIEEMCTPGRHDKGSNYCLYCSHFVCNACYFFGKILQKYLWKLFWPQTYTIFFRWILLSLLRFGFMVFMGKLQRHMWKWISTEAEKYLF